jgi:hypothetical protein
MHPAYLYDALMGHYTWATILFPVARCLSSLRSETPNSVRCFVERDCMILLANAQLQVVEMVAYGLKPAVCSMS